MCLTSFPFLDYRLYHQIKDEGKLFRFTGEIESIIDGHTLWVKGKDLTIPINIKKIKCFLLPVHDEEGESEAPQYIRWDRVSLLQEGAKVFIGGIIKMYNNRLSFVTTKEEPLMVIFYNCPDTELTNGIIRTARTRNEYWNSLTPASLVIGALSLIFIAATFLDRPAFRLTVIASFTAVFIPILPVLPPGFLFTVLYRRLTWDARKLRIKWDFARFGLLDDSSVSLVKHYAIRSYVFEALAWFFMLLGVSINLIFIFLILFLFNIVSF